MCFVLKILLDNTSYILPTFSVKDKILDFRSVSCHPSSPINLWDIQTIGEGVRFTRFLVDFLDVPRNDSPKPGCDTMKRHETQKDGLSLSHTRKSLSRDQRSSLSSVLFGLLAQGTQVHSSTS